MKHTDAPEQRVEARRFSHDPKRPGRLLTLCCNYSFEKTDCPVMWNESNQVVQCHNCGHCYEPIPLNASQPASAAPDKHHSGSETPQEPPYAQSGVVLIAAERERQITVEGWAPEHDDYHDQRQLRNAAVYYACAGSWPSNLTEVQKESFWPWDEEWKKVPMYHGQVDRFRCLVKAGALIAAEIDRLIRAGETYNGIGLGARPLVTLDELAKQTADELPPYIEHSWQERYGIILAALKKAQGAQPVSSSSQRPTGSDKQANSDIPASGRCRANNYGDIF